MKRRGTECASGVGATFAVMGVVGLSVAAFFLFTLPGSKKDKDEDEDPAAEGGETPAEVEPGGEPEPDPTGGGSAEVIPQVPDEPEPEPEPDKPGPRTSPAALVGEIASRLSGGDIDGAHELIGAEIGGGRAALAAVFGKEGYTPAADQPPSEVGLIGDVTRWVVPVRKRLEASPTDPAERVFFDLALKAGVGPDAGAGWAVRDLHYPGTIRSLASASAPEPADGRAAGEEDALIMADGFITAITSRDFAKGLQNCSPEVPEEKIAGLCIVFEEGEFKLRKEKPLVATALGGETAWVIAHVESEKLGTGTEFGLEMKRKAAPAPAVEGEAPPPADWEIVGINFGKLLDTYVAASEAGKVPYTPIKSSPGSGEMLVMYFEYDDVKLLPRAQRQLQIISGILKADAGKTLSISGHADALGSEDYNARLSAARAAAVKAQLALNGVPEGQILAKGLGESQPWKPNQRADGTDDPKARAYNRRAEIYLNF